MEKNRSQGRKAEAKGKILIIEDNAPYARYLGNWLRPHGYEVEIACHSASAKKMLGGKNTYVCVLADIRLPDGDGVEILAWMRKRGISIPYIVMTQNEDVTSAVKAISFGERLGADIFISCFFSLTGSDFFTSLFCSASVGTCSPLGEAADFSSEGQTTPSASQNSIMLLTSETVMPSLLEISYFSGISFWGCLYE